MYFSQKLVGIILTVAKTNQTENEIVNFNGNKINWVHIVTYTDK